MESATKWKFDEFHMPDVWHNEDTVYEFMLPFKRPRHIDPVAYDKKINFWRELVLKYANHYHIVALNEASLVNLFTKTFSDHSKERPQCLSTVLSEMLRTGEIVNAQDSGALGKIMRTTFDYFVKRPLSWSWSKVVGDNATPALNTSQSSSNSGPPGAQENLFLIPEAVDHCASEFIQTLRNRIPLRLTHRLPVTSAESFDALLESYFPHEVSRNYMRQYLLNRGLISRHQVSQGKGASFSVIKFTEKDSQTTSVGDINAEEGSVLAGILYLRQVISTLEVEETYLQDKLAQRHEQIRALMRANKKEDAKQLLRRSKLVEKAVEEKRGQLQNLEGMLLQVESASNNRQVVSALSMAGKSLRTAAAHAENSVATGKTGLTLTDTVEDALAEIADSIAQQKEVLDTLAGPPADEAELAELEDELEDLIREQPQEEQLPPAGAKRKLANLTGRKSEQEKSIDEALEGLDLSDVQLPDVSHFPAPSDSPVRPERAT